MTSMNTVPAIVELNTCHDCHAATTAPARYVMMNYDYTKHLYDFTLCPVCETLHDAAESGVSIKEYLEVRGPADMATDLKRGMISQQEHDEWLVWAETIKTQAIAEGVYA